jgi:hypothetical protein
MKKAAPSHAQGVHQFYRRYLQRRTQDALGRNVICVESDHHPNQHRTSTGTKTNFGRNSATARGSSAKSRRHQTQ